MKSKWNVNPEHPTTIARLLSELEGVYYILTCLDDVEDEIDFIEKMKKKYYKEYFKKEREYKSNAK